MGKLEKHSYQKKRNRDLQRLVMETVAFTGVLGASFVAPNALGAMKKLGLLPTRRQKESINTARDRLIKKQLLERDAKGLLRITAKGEHALYMLRARAGGLPRPRRWDRRWRVLIFDIPDYRKGLRDRLRQSLRSVGFILLQGSVWVYPYDCEDFVALLKADFKIGKAMRYLIADTIENDRELKERFELV